MWRTPRRHSAAGFGLIEVMIAAFLIMVLGAAITSLLRQQSNTVTAFRGVSTRDQVARRILAAGASSAALCTSRDKPDNRLSLQVCLAQRNCPRTKIGFHLYDSFGTLLAGPDNANTGMAKPVRYRLDGSKCSQPSAQCPIEAYASFEASCKGASGSACLPMTMKVHYTIRQARGVKIPGMADLKEDKGEATEVKIQDVCTMQSGLRCMKPEEVLRGINADGTPDCVKASQALGYEVVDGTAARVSNPNPTQRTNDCGWPHTPRMQHVWGEVECPPGKVPTGGGGECNSGKGGFLETAKLTGDRRWMVDCCKYDPYPSSRIWVYCINDPGAP